MERPMTSNAFRSAHQAARGSCLSPGAQASSVLLATSPICPSARARLSERGSPWHHVQALLMHRAVHRLYTVHSLGLLRLLSRRRRNSEYPRTSPVIVCTVVSEGRRALVATLPAWTNPTALAALFFLPVFNRFACLPA